jgi:hypothetical protein
VLASNSEASITILTSSRNRPRGCDGFGTAFDRAKIATTLPTAIYTSMTLRDGTVCKPIRL